MSLKSSDSTTSTWCSVMLDTLADTEASWRTSRE
jgi:hypothetical protein